MIFSVVFSVLVFVFLGFCLDSAVSFIVFLGKGESSSSGGWFWLAGSLFFLFSDRFFFAFLFFFFLGRQQRGDEHREAQGAWQRGVHGQLHPR